jgi:hypothetical protein
MSYPGVVPEALADQIRAAVDIPAVFATPPRTFNPPAVIVRLPDSIEPSGAAFTIDRAEVGVLCAVGADQTAELYSLLGEVRKAILANRTLGGAAQVVAVVNYRNFAQMNVGGADYLTAELLLEIHA